jgi:hypothetical protein
MAIRTDDGQSGRITAGHSDVWFVRQNRPPLFVASDRMAVSAILMLTSSDRTRGHGLLRAIDTGRLVFHVLATSGAK